MNNDLLNIAELMQSDKLEDVQQSIVLLRELTTVCKIDTIIDEIIHYANFHFMQKLKTLFLNHLHIQNDNDLHTIGNITWIFINIASSPYTNILIKYNLIEPIYSLITNPNSYVREYSIHCLANIAGHSDEYRNLILEQPKLIEYLTLNFEYSLTCENCTGLLDNLVFLLKNLLFTEPKQEFEEFRSLSIYAFQCTLHLNKNVKLTALRFSFSVCTNDNNINYILDSNIIPNLIYELESLTDNKIILHIVQLLGNIAASVFDEHTQYLIDHNIIETSIHLLNTNKNDNILRECCFLLSNICAGTQEQAHVFINTPNALSTIIAKLNHYNIRIQIEAVWTLEKIFKRDIPIELKQIITEHSLMIYNLCNVINNNDDLLSSQISGNNQNIFNVLNILIKSMEIDEEQVMEQIASVFGKISELQNHSCKTISIVSEKIIAKINNFNELQYL